MTNITEHTVYRAMRQLKKNWKGAKHSLEITAFFAAHIVVLPTVHTDNHSYLHGWDVLSGKGICCVANKKAGFTNGSKNQIHKSQNDFGAKGSNDYFLFPTNVTVKVQTNVSDKR